MGCCYLSICYLFSFTFSHCVGGVQPVVMNLFPGSRHVVSIMRYPLHIIYFWPFFYLIFWSLSIPWGLLAHWRCFAKKLKRLKTNYIVIGPPTDKHLTDREPTHRGIKLLPSSALLSGYIHRYATELVLPRSANGFILPLYDKTRCKKVTPKNFNRFEPITLQERECILSNRFEPTNTLIVHRSETAMTLASRKSKFDL